MKILTRPEFIQEFIEHEKVHYYRRVYDSGKIVWLRAYSHKLDEKEAKILELIYQKLIEK